MTTGTSLPSFFLRMVSNIMSSPAIDLLLRSSLSITVFLSGKIIPSLIFLPFTSSKVYPKSSVNFLLIFKMVPLPSWYIPAIGLFSNRLNASSWLFSSSPLVFFISEISISMITIPATSPLSSIIGELDRSTGNN